MFVLTKKILRVIYRDVNYTIVYVRINIRHLPNYIEMSEGVSESKIVLDS